MKALTSLAVAAAALLWASGAAAQFVLLDDNMTQVTRPDMPQGFWSPKLTPTPYAAPNKLLWKLSDILAAHRGQGDWTQAIVRNREQEADYISLGVGKKTKALMYGDDRLVFIVQDGAVRVTIDGVAPFTATRGFMVSVPMRRVFTLETVGDKPALRFEVRNTGAVALYPLSETPDAMAGAAYVQATGRPGPGRIGYEGNPVWVDFWKTIGDGDLAGSSRFAADDNVAVNIIRGKGAAVPPASNKGHFHALTEFWYVMEGKIGYQVEGFPYFEAEPGDVVNAGPGRWHRAGFAPQPAMSTRIAFNPRPALLHSFEPVPETKP